MRLLQLNIWEGRLLRQVLNLVAQADPDILCMQEVFGCERGVPKPVGIFDAFQKIRQINDYRHSFFSPTFSTEYAGETVDYGNAILSKFPLEDQQTIFTSGAYNPHLTAHTFVPNHNNLQLTRVRTPSGDFSLANHHGHCEIERLGSEVSVQKMRVVSEQLRQLSGPLVFAGDLNVIAASPAMRVFDGYLEDLTAAYHISTTLTDLGKVNDAACDHILISPEVQVRKFRVTDGLVSDHRPLILDFDI